MSVLLLLALPRLLLAQEPEGTFRCPVTLPPEDGAPFGNDALETGLWPDGKVTFEPGGPGFVTDEGALGMKWWWTRRPGVEGRLFVGGRRLDGDGTPAQAWIYDYGLTGFQPTYLVFPGPGCWEITGGVAGRTLTFVVLVEKIGDGPSWRPQGDASEGMRVTTHWVDPAIESTSGEAGR